MHPSIQADHSAALRCLKDFFDLIDSKQLFDKKEPAFFFQMRDELYQALDGLLVWGRPFLERGPGLMWPYEALAEQAPFFEALARNGSDRFVREQARRFLARLPFPGQWSHLLRLQAQLDPEIKRLLAQEKEKTQRKLEKKAQKRFKLRHFCQILKTPEPSGEKGVLRIFSLPYIFLNSKLLAALSREYFLYLEPPMGVVFRHAWWRYFCNLEDPPLFGAGGSEDRAFLQAQGAFVTELAHGDFLEDIDWPQTDGGQKDYDIGFNASFDDLDRKRHGLMLKLLQSPELGRCRALFLGRGEPEAVAEFQRQVKAAGLADQVSTRANLRRAEVPAYLARCKLGVHLSLYENACRGIYEFFRTDTPCVVSAAMAGMNLDIFNRRTGAAVPDEDLAATIAWSLENLDQYHPRQWFLAHSGTANSTARLNKRLQSIFEKLGYRWTRDIVGLGSSGASRYVNTADYQRFMPAFERLLALFRAHSDVGERLSLE